MLKPTVGLVDVGRVGAGGRIVPGLGKQKGGRSVG